ncbi:hypothetical protein Sru01_46620 [Sphaerisporangium rufum]|uniref:DUF4352 domain-containing protein n=1 Tax=Sphaerisporangium rufum TaxID=1381558 RepID=A0A919V6T7_9ACTN|nr:hypothetical protein [Sphaerisporangium rufum]GII79680.1 hypothetical protein Sru01_46620 [Sphaerisporangium rufum]
MIDPPSGRPAAPAPVSPRRAPAWRRLLHVAVGLALIGGAGYAHEFVLPPDRLDDPLTATGGPREEIRMDTFSARLEEVRFARSVRVKKEFGTDEATTRQIFLVAKVGATSVRKPLKLSAFLLTADGLRFDPTDRVDAGATLAEKWVQPGWWRSGLYFFEVPPDKVAGARVVVTDPQVLFEDWVPEVAMDLGLDEAGARRMISEAEDGYEVTG